MRDTARRTTAASIAHAEAFERMTMPHLDRVERFARALTRDAARAEDLVQETYLQALRGWHTFRNGADARPWLFKICHNAFLRTTKREARYVEAPEDDPELESLATAAAHGLAQQEGIAEAVEQMDLRAEIDRALSTLPPYFRGAWCSWTSRARVTTKPRRCSTSPSARCARVCSAPAGCCRTCCSSMRAPRDFRPHDPRPPTRHRASAPRRHPLPPRPDDGAHRERTSDAGAHRLRDGGPAPLGLHRRPARDDGARRGGYAPRDVRELPAALRVRAHDARRARLRSCPVPPTRTPRRGCASACASP